VEEAIMKKNATKPGPADVQSQSRDSAGLNPKRDGTRPRGRAAVGLLRGQGTKGFRKRRSSGE
jgi:hypothetical protein